jgi:hypothetical protein
MKRTAREPMLVHEVAHVLTPGTGTARSAVATGCAETGRAETRGNDEVGDDAGVVGGVQAADAVVWLVTDATLCHRLEAAPVQHVVDT